MPLFLGAVWNEINSERANHYRQHYLNVIQKNSARTPIETGTHKWLVCAALGTHETNQEELILLPQHSGIAIGRFYNNEGRSLTSGFTEKWLSEEGWGRHTLILCDDTNNKFSIYRDAVGLSHVYYIHNSIGIFFSSDIHLLLEATKNDNKQYQHDWEYFASYVSYGSLNTAKTPFKEVHELLPGSCLTYHYNKLKTFSYWDPTHYALETAPIENNIVATLNDNVEKWISGASNICLQLSGGLDSSALFLSIKKSLKKDQQLILVNYLNSTVAASDESEHVKKLVGASPAELIFHEIHYTTQPPTNEKWSRPHQCILGIGNKTSLLEKLNYKNIEFYSGHGGDHVFLANASPSFLTDYFLQKGCKGFINKLKEASLINREPALPYLYKMLKDLYQHLFKIKSSHKANFTPSSRDWFNEKFKALINSDIYLPPFWQNLAKMYPGKAFQILQTYHASAHVGFELAGSPEVFPYLSQPLIKRTLSIPTYDTFNKNWTRVHFRKAVSDYFDTNLVWRQSKGEASGVIQMCLKKNLRRVQELCLEGRFSRQNLINKDLLNKHIILLANGRMDQQSLLTRLLSAELWFENWQ